MSRPAIRVFSSLCVATLLGVGVLLSGCEQRTKPPRPSVSTETANRAAPGTPANANPATTRPAAGNPGGTSRPASRPTSRPAPSVAKAGERWAGGGLSWVVPTGWAQQAGSGMRFATLVHEDGTNLTVTPLVAQPLEANVTRWRGQLGLAPATPSELEKCTEQVSVGGKPGTIVDISGQGQRIIVLMVNHGQASWFFKLHTDEATVGKHAKAFREYVDSIGFE